jgi:hypothetical protein
MKKMNRSNTSVSINPTAVPVVLASNLTYQEPKQLASGYILSVTITDEEAEAAGDEEGKG